MGESSCVRGRRSARAAESADEISFSEDDWPRFIVKATSLLGSGSLIRFQLRCYSSPFR